MPGAALITDHNYSTGFRQVRGLGHDLLRVMGIPTLPGQPILPALAIMALAAFGLEGIALNAYTNSLPEALASLANSNLALGGFVLVSSAAIALLAFAAARWLRQRAPAPRAGARACPGVRQRHSYTGGRRSSSCALSGTTGSRSPRPACRC